LSCSDQEESIQSLNVIKRGGCVQFSTCYLGIPELSRGNRVGTCRRVGASAWWRVWRVWRVWRGRSALVVSPIFTFARSIDKQRRSRGSATLPRHTRRHAHAPTRRPADTPIRRYADTPIRRYADTTPLNCPTEHGTFACFEAAQKYLVRLHRERLPKSDGRGVIPPDGCESP
jgi:hypothetical protein